MAIIKPGVHCLIISGTNAGKEVIALHEYFGPLPSNIREPNASRWHVRALSPVKTVRASDMRKFDMVAEFIIKSRSLMPLDPDQYACDEQKEKENEVL